MARWIEQNVRLGLGDYYGEPFHLTSYQRRWIHRLYEYYPETGLRRYKRALLGTAKGNGKTPFESAVGATELAGPVAVDAPFVLVAASTKDQADLVFGDMREGIRHSSSPLKPFLDAMQYSIQRKDGPGIAKRVAAVDGSNDGPRATCLLADELHEWLGRLANVFTVLDGAIGKLKNAFTLMISTSGHDRDSLLGQQYERGKRVASGEIVDDAFLFEWYEAPDWLEVPAKIETDEDLAAWEEAVLWANPALAEADFLTWDYIRSRFDGAQTVERFKWERYHLNRWTRAESQWLPPGAWEDDQREKKVKPHSEVYLGFKGSYAGDQAALIGCTPAGHIFTLGIWDDPGNESYRVPRAAIQKELRAAMERYSVLQLASDPPGWVDEIEDWADAYGDSVAVRFETNRRKRWVEACDRFYTAALGGTLTHDGDSRLARHMEAAVVKEHVDGAFITRSAGAMAAVLAHESAKTASSLEPLVAVL